MFSSFAPLFSLADSMARLLANASILRDFIALQPLKTTQAERPSCIHPRTIKARIHISETCIRTIVRTAR